MDEKETNTQEGVTSTEAETQTKSASSEASLLDQLMRSVKELSDTVKKANERKHSDGTQRSDDREKIDRISKDVTELRGLVDRENNMAARKGEYDTKGDIQEVGGLRLSPNSVKSLIHIPAAPGSDIAQIQQFNDDAYIGTTLLKLAAPSQSKRLMEYLRGQYPVAFKAMYSTGTNVGDEFVPTELSRDLIELVKLELRMAALFQRFNMPSNPYQFPIEGADATAYLVAERTGDDDVATAGLWVPASTPGTGNISFTAKKVGVRSVVSAEVTEDSIIPIIPFVRMKVVRSMAELQENVVINGDTTASSSNILGTTPSSTSQLLTFAGIRKAANTAGTTSDVAGKLSGNTGLTALRKLRSDMGKYAVSLQDLVYFTGVNGYNQILSVDQVVTMDKFGSRATILNGQIGSLDGIPIVISEFVNVNHLANGTGSTGSKTIVGLVNRSCFKFGDLRDITLKSREIIETDQIVMVALQRLDFQPLYTPSATNTICAVGVNVTLA